VNAFKPHLADVADYPYLKAEARIKLDQNESPEDLPPEVKRRALAQLADLPWNRYPELHADDVRADLARHEGWPEDGLVLSPGSNLLILALASAARAVVDTAPAFPYYRGAAVATNTPYRSVPLGAGFSLPLEPLLAELDGPPGVLFLPNPHAPTGALFAAGEVARLAEKARTQGWLLVLDEAYQAFSGTDQRPLARENASVAILRTFSKAWCLGGIRTGYLLGSPRVAAVVRSLIPPFVIPAHTGVIIRAALEAPGYVDGVVARIRAERTRLLAALPLAQPRWTVYPSVTNFLLVRTPDAKATWEHLLSRGVLVRRQDHYAGLAGCVRISVGTPAENDALLAAARQAP
jgi:histidinol-phosphate aminotransferase